MVRGALELPTREGNGPSKQPAGGAMMWAKAGRGKGRLGEDAFWTRRAREGGDINLQLAHPNRGPRRSRARERAMGKLPLRYFDSGRRARTLPNLPRVGVPIHTSRWLSFGHLLYVIDSCGQSKDSLSYRTAPMAFHTRHIVRMFTVTVV